MYPNPPASNRQVAAELTATVRAPTVADRQFGYDVPVLNGRGSEVYVLAGRN